MGYKSRGNFSVGTCFDSCKCRQCRKDDNLVVEKSKRATESLPGVIVYETQGKDGSRLEKPMSKAYIDHIRSRTKESVKKMKPNMGAYGA